MNWQNPDESWRFNLFVGQQTRLFSNWEEETARPLSSGVMLNHLLTPSVIIGASSQYIDQRWQHGLSADWSLDSQWRLFGNLMATQGLGSGFDLQALYYYGDGSLVLSHQQQRQQEQAYGRAATSSRATCRCSSGSMRATPPTSIWPIRWGAGWGPIWAGATTAICLVRQ